MNTNTRPQRTKAATVSLEMLADLLGYGRSTTYDEARRTGTVAGLPVIKVGSRFRVPTVAVERLLGIDVADYFPDEPVDAS